MNGKVIFSKFDLSLDIEKEFWNQMYLSDKKRLESRGVTFIDPQIRKRPA